LLILCPRIPSQAVCLGGREERLRFAKLCTAGILENCRQKEIMQNFTNYGGATNGRTGLKEQNDLYSITLFLQ
jgi:hypothetical protein